jgi:hypothetical protein
MMEELSDGAMKFYLNDHGDEEGIYEIAIKYLRGLPEERRVKRK